MSKPGLSFGLSLKKTSSSKPAPARRKPTFGADEDSDDDSSKPAAGSTTAKDGGRVEWITELDLDANPAAALGADDESEDKKSRARTRDAAPPPPLSSRPRPPRPQAAVVATEDLSSALASRRHAAEAEALDPSVYDYDAVYDTLKRASSSAARRGGGAGDGDAAERRPKYMGSLLAAASVRERDRLIAEEKRLAREREAEGDAFADKEKFVTEAYRRQQEENRRLEEEERRREEEEARRDKNKGLTGFYKEMLEREERAHAEKMRAVEEAKKAGPRPPHGQRKEGEEEEEEKEKTEAELAEEILRRGGKITVNEDGQIVDKRELLQGGLNVAPKKKAEIERERARKSSSPGAAASPGRGGVVGAGGGKRAMRERQSRMLEAQLEESLKRAREEEEAERRKIELVSKSRKTEAEISSARERYLARKRAAEEEKRQGLTDQP